VADLLKQITSCCSRSTSCSRSDVRTRERTLLPRGNKAKNGREIEGFTPTPLDRSTSFFGDLNATTLEQKRDFHDNQSMPHIL